LSAERTPQFLEFDLACRGGGKNLAECLRQSEYGQITSDCCCVSKRQKKIVSSMSVQAEQGQNANCKVALRLRPHPAGEIDRGSAITVGPDGCSVVVTSDGHTESYPMDLVFPHGANQDEVYTKSVQESVLATLEGINSTVLAYGQSSSGKTYTIFGGPREHRGLVPRAFEDMFQKMGEMHDVDWVVKLSLLEIYKEELKDLLRPGACKLRLRESVFAGVWVEGLNHAYVSSAQAATDLVLRGMAGRSVSATGMNDKSSRSHCILSLTVESTRPDGKTYSAVLRFADLAGIERVDRTEAEGQVLEEAKRINLSLSALGNCISALSQSGRTHIPFRDSKLTFLLQGSLGGNARTTLLITCSPCLRDHDDSLGAIKFGMILLLL
jgi:kinesin family protein 5